jgi:hypothetical protein
MALVVSSLLTGCTRPDWRTQLQSEDPLHRISGAITAGQARDRSAAPLLVDCLQDNDEAVRMYAILALKRIEGTDLGYRSWADEADRTHLAQRWRRYLQQKHAGEAPPGVAGHPSGPATAPSPSQGKEDPGE